MVIVEKLSEEQMKIDKEYQDRMETLISEGKEKAMEQETREIMLTMSLPKAVWLSVEGEAAVVERVGLDELLSRRVQDFIMSTMTMQSLSILQTLQENPESGCAGDSGKKLAQWLSALAPPWMRAHVMGQGRMISVAKTGPRDS
jgi:hypothetical protein